MKLSFRKKLKQVGMLSLHALVPVVIAVVAIGGIGAYVLTKSQAAAYLTSSECLIRGRVWNGSLTGNPCSNTCKSGAGSIVTASPYNYCSGAISKISKTTCDNTYRKWIDQGCARRWQQTNLANAPQCTNSGATYTVKSPYDQCIGGKLESISCALGTLKLENGRVKTWLDITNNSKVIQKFTLYSKTLNNNGVVYNQTTPSTKSIYPGTTIYYSGEGGSVSKDYYTFYTVFAYINGEKKTCPMIYF
jgi:hypothetical protein